MKSWHVIADPAWKGMHPLHDARFVATCDESKIEVTEYGKRKAWRFEDPADSIICTMPDSMNQKEHARLIAAAPDLLEACKFALEIFACDPHRGRGNGEDAALARIKFAIQKAEGAQ